MTEIRKRQRARFDIYRKIFEKPDTLQKTRQSPLRFIYKKQHTLYMLRHFS